MGEGGLIGKTGEHARHYMNGMERTGASAAGRSMAYHFRRSGRPLLFFHALSPLNSLQEWEKWRIINNGTLCLCQ